MHDVVDGARANLEQVDELEKPIAALLDVALRGEPRALERCRHDRQKTLGGRAAQMLAVHPLEFLRIEDRRLF